jgi:hypothetical protein
MQKWQLWTEKVTLQLKRYLLSVHSAQSLIIPVSMETLLDNSDPSGCPTKQSLLRCCYITVDSATTALQNGACTYRCTSKQMHYKTPFSCKGYLKSLEFYENYITLFCLKKKTFWQYYINSEPCMAWHITQSGWNNYLVKQQLRNNTILSRGLFWNTAQ